MENKQDVIDFIIENTPGAFESINGKEIRVPLTNGKEVKLTVTQAKEALRQKPEFSDTPTQVEQDQLASLLSALQI